ncbi:DUF202 domain-containing protein [Rhodococcus gannanensis]|uniref:DUF202 domain-containing protein n=1 Tax=Rhodococcus gannanensis TaxID=1960308 RepID=A0ABW4P401_9NOCA
MSTDSGLANERTALAWQRTALSVVVGTAVITRLVGLTSGFMWVAFLVGVTLLVAWALAMSRVRCLRVSDSRRGAARSGLPSLMLAGVVCLVGVGELIVVLV